VQTLFVSRAVGIWAGTYSGIALSSDHSAGARHHAVRAKQRTWLSFADPPTGHCRPDCVLACRCCRGSADARCYGWAAFVTQAGITLGLSDELALNFPTWGPALQAPLVSSVVFSQIVGPPLLKAALAKVGEVHASYDASARAQGADTHADEAVGTPALGAPLCGGDRPRPSSSPGEQL
jgi:hypothetical protein